jgi:hypothetical protein
MVRMLLAQGEDEEQVITAVLYAVVTLVSRHRDYPRATLRRLRFAVDRALPRALVEPLVALAKACLGSRP